HKSLTFGIIQTSLATASLTRDFLSREKRMTAGRRRRQTPRSERKAPRRGNDQSRPERQKAKFSSKILSKKNPPYFNTHIT
ncbi:MAG: hypothetical protein LIP00_03860, partial [Parabacteroides sp.]|nr:hypothetical protein [Parabacteroides sp.]